MDGQVMSRDFEFLIVDMGIQFSLADYIKEIVGKRIRGKRCWIRGKR